MKIMVNSKDLVTAVENGQNRTSLECGDVVIHAIHNDREGKPKYLFGRGEDGPFWARAEDFYGERGEDGDVLVFETAGTPTSYSMKERG